MKIYIAGPMTNYPQFNIPAFDELAASLRALGNEVVNPAELDGDEVRAFSLASPDGDPNTILSHGMTHGDCLARDVKLIADGGLAAIVVLPGWEKSDGARHETFVAFLNGIPVMYPSHVEGMVSLDKVTELQLFRAWTGDPTLRIRQRSFR